MTDKVAHIIVWTYCAIALKLTQSALLKTWITIYSLAVSMRTANHNIKMSAFCPHSAFMFPPLGGYGLCVQMNLQISTQGIGVRDNYRLPLPVDQF